MLYLNNLITDQEIKSEIDESSQNSQGFLILFREVKIMQQLYYMQDLVPLISIKSHNQQLLQNIVQTEHFKTFLI